MDPLLQKNLISTKEASELSGYNSDYLARLCKSHKIRGQQIGRAWLVEKASLEAFIALQGERKIDRARTLARVREEEYRVAQEPVQAVKPVVRSAPRITEYTTQLPAIESGIRLSPWTGVLAAFAAVLIVGTSAYAAESSALPLIAQRVAALAAQAERGFAPFVASAFEQASSSVESAHARETSAQIAADARIARVTPEVPAPLASLTLHAPAMALVLPPAHAQLAFAVPRATAHAAKPLDVVGAATSTIGFVLSAPEALRAVTLAIGTLGNSLETLAASAPRASVAFASGVQQAAIAFGTSAARAAYGVEYAIAERFVGATNSTLVFEADTLESGGTVAYAGVETIAAVAQDSTGSLRAPLATAQKYALGLIGKSALALNSLARPAAAPRLTAAAADTAVAPSLDQGSLTTGESVALTTYETIHGFFEGVTDSLATIFAPRAIVILPGTPSAPIAIATTTINTSTTVVHSGPTYNSYPTVVQGVSQATLTSSLASLKSDVLTQVMNITAGLSRQVATNENSIQQVNIIQSLTDLILHAPVIDHAQITDSSFSGSNVDATAGTFDSLTVNGVPITSSGGAVATSIAGFFTATDTAASSSFAGDVVIGGNATSTSFFASLVHATTGIFDTLSAGTLALTNALGISSGGTGTSTAPTYGQVLVGNANGGYDLVATSSLGIAGTGGGGGGTWGSITGTLSDQTDLQTALDAKLNASAFGAQFYNFLHATNTDALAEGLNNLYWTNDRFDARLAATTTLPNLASLPSLGTVSTSLTGILKATAGVLSNAVPGTDYENPLTFAYPLVRSSDAISLAFGTTTSNIWGGTQTFTAAPVLGALTGLIYGNSGVLATTSTTTLSTSGVLAFSGGNPIALGSAPYALSLSNNSTLTTSGSTLGINLANANTWTALQQFNGNASTTGISATYASSTRAYTGALTVTGATTLATSLTGILKATAGVVSAGLVNLASDITGVLPEANGGTGQTSYSAGDILYADNSGNLTTLPIGSAGKVLTSVGGFPSWQAATGGSGGSGVGNGWATTTDNLALHPSNISWVTIFGDSSTSTLNSILEVHGDQYISGKLGIGTTSPVADLSVGGNGYLTGGFGVGLVNTVAGTLKTAGAAIIGGALNVSGATTLATSLTGILKATAGVVSAGLVDLTADITGVLPIANGGTSTSTAPTANKLLLSDANGNWEYVATSSLGIQAGVTSVSNSDGSLTISPSTGDVIASLALGHSNVWSALQQFNGNASSTNFSANVASFGATATSSFASNGALTLATALGISSGGTNAGSQTTNGVNYFNGTSITSGTGFIFNGTSVGIGTTSPTGLLDVGASGITSTGEAYPAYTAGIHGQSASNATLLITNSGAVSRQSGIAFRSTTSSINKEFTSGHISSGFTGTGYASTFLTLGSGSNANTYNDELTLTNGFVGIGTTTPATLLNIVGTSPVARIRNTSNGQTSISQTTPGLEIVSSGTVSAAGKYVGALKFGAADADFTTTNPKFGALIAGYATENYTADTSSGMGLEFFTTPNAAGATPTPTSRLVIDQNGNVGIASSTPWGLLSVNANGLATGVPQFVVGSSTATSFIVANSGMVGIGTANPTTPLYVTTSNSQTATFESSNAVESNILQTTAAVSTSNIVRQQFSAMSSTQLRPITRFDANFKDTTDATRTGHFGIFNSDAGTFTEKFSIDGSNIGIGTTTPNANALLSVAGNIYGSGSLTATNLTATGTIAVQGTGTSTFAGNGSFANLAITGIASGNLLKTGAGGYLVPAVAGTDYLTSASGVSSIAQTYGSAQTGAITLATTSSATTGLTIAENITNTAGAFTFAPTLSGKLAIANGGTNANTQTTNGVNYFDGTSITSGSVLTFSGTTLSISTGTGTLSAGTVSALAGLTLSGGAAGAITFQSGGSTRFTLSGTGVLQSNSSTGAFVTSAASSGTAPAFGPNRSDVTTGIGSLTTGASGSLSLITAGVDRLEVTNSGLIGIGTTSPYAALSVEGKSALGNSALAGFFIATTTTASTFPNASTTLASVATGLYNTYLTSGRVPFTTTSGLLTDSANLTFNGTTLTANTLALTNALPIASGGTFATSQTTNGVNYFNGTSITSGTGLTFTGTNLGVGSTTPWGLVSINANGLAAGVPQFVVGSSTATNFIVANNGQVGIGTTTTKGLLILDQPSGEADLNIETGDTSVVAVRYINTAASWRSGIQNTSDFAIRDVTNSRTPFTIQQNAPNNSFYIASSGNVGIGTTTPGGNLAVLNSASGPGFIIGNSSNATQFIVDSTGKVGIGTTTPASQLSIYGSAGTGVPTAGGGTLLIDSNTAGVGDGGAILFGGGSTPARFAGIKAYLQNNGSNTGDLAFYTANGSLTEKLRITAAGSLGVGTTTPSGKLEVYSGASGLAPNANSDDLVIENSGNVGISLLASSGTENLFFGTAAANTAGRVTYDTSANTLELWSNNARHLQIDSSGNVGLGGSVAASGLTGSVLVALANGNVGIGSSTPTNTLAISAPSVGNGISFDANGASLGSLARQTLGGVSVLDLNGSATGTVRPVSIGGTVNTNVLLANAGGNVGIGTTTPQAKLAINGTFRTEAVPWSTSYTSPTFTGSGQGNALAVYDGKLYLGYSGFDTGVVTPGGVAVYDGNYWTTATTTVPNTTVNGSTALGVYKGKLYSFFTDPGGNTGIYAYNGTTWTETYATTSASTVTAFAVYNGAMYAAYTSPGSSQGDVYSSTDGATWTLSNDFGASIESVWTLYAWNGKLYAGTGRNAGDGDLYAFDGSTWSKVWDFGANIESVRSMAAYNGKLYIGTGDSTATLPSPGDDSIYVFDGTTATLQQQSFLNGATQSAGEVTSLLAYNGLLYAGEGTGFNGADDIYSYDGNTWTKVLDNSAGSTNVTLPAMAIYNGQLFATKAGSGSSSGTAVFMYGDRLESQLAYSLSQPGNTTSANEQAQNYTANATYSPTAFLGVGSTTPWARLSVDTSLLSATTPYFAVGSSTSTSFLVANNGYVGIGTTSPFARLSLVNNAVAPAFSVSSAAGASQFIIGANGNIGIGTSTPNWLLSLSGGAFHLKETTDMTQAFSIENSFGTTTFSADTVDANTLIFSVASSTGIDAFDVAATGNVGISTSTPWGKLAISLAAGDTNTNAFIIASSTTGATTTLFSVSNTGNATFTGSGGTCVINGSGACTSDQRLKTNITAISGADALSKLALVSGVTYNWLDPALNQDQQVGVIAQDVQKAFPQLVGTVQTPFKGELGTYYTVNYAGLVSPLISAVNALNQRTAAISSSYGSATSTASTSPIIAIDMSGNVAIGTTTASANLTVYGTLSAKNYEAAAATPTGFTLASTTFSATLPSVVLSANGNVDLYKLATYNLSGIQSLVGKIALQDARMDSLESRISKLESGAVTSSSSSPFSTSTLASALSAFGAFIQNGIAQFGSLVADQFVAATNSAGTSSAGSGTVLAGNTTVLVSNAYVHPTSKIFVTFTSAAPSGWYLAEKQQGSFKVVLAAASTNDVTFDYFIVQTEGQIATSTPATSDSGSSTPPAGTPDPTPPPGIVVPPPSGSGSGTPTASAPVVTLNGSAAMQITQGDTFADPGATAMDAAGVDISSSIVESGAVDAATPGSYTLTYTATDSSGTTASASRLVTVLAPPVSDSGDGS